MALEIERKFLCNLTREEAIELAYASRHVKSVYLENTKEFSVRVVSDSYDLGGTICKWTTKTSTHNALVRTELEDRLPVQIFNALDNGTYPTISKRRYLIDVDDEHTWEVDFFDDYDFVIAELEFKSVEEAQAFTNFPSWIEKEVTNDPFYLNCNLAK